MAITTYEGIVENGKIRLRRGVRLPDKTKVYVIVPKAEERKTARVTSPRLVHHKQVADFRMDVAPEEPNDSLRQ